MRAPSDLLEAPDTLSMQQIEARADDDDATCERPDVGKLPENPVAQTRDRQQPEIAEWSQDAGWRMPVSDDE